MFNSRLEAGMVSLTGNFRFTLSHYNYLKENV